MESGGVLRGVRVDPQRGSAELSGGVSCLLRGVKPPDLPPVKYSPVLTYTNFLTNLLTN